MPEELVVVPQERSLVLRRLKRSRSAPEVLMVLRLWFERRMDRRADVVYSAQPSFHWEYDASRRAHTAYFYWSEADLPPGYGRAVYDPRHDRVSLMHNA